MSMAAPPTEVVGNPVRRDLLLRSLRSNTNATILTVWTVLIGAIGVVVLINQAGLSSPFDPSEGSPEPVGRALGQWWIVSITAGMCLLGPVLATVACAGHGEGRRLQGWATTLVGPGRVVTGVWQQQLALLVLASVLALPVAGLALGLGGTSPAQLGIGVAGAFLAGATTGALAITLSCRSERPFVPLAASLVVVVALFAVPFAVHQIGHERGGDPVLAVIPVVAVADVAAPHAAPSPATAGAADAPLTHLRASATSGSAPVPPWGWAAGGAVLAIVVLLVVAALRVARPPRQRG